MYWISLIINTSDKEIEHKNNIINNITRHNHNNYEHNVLKRINKTYKPYE